METTLLGVKMIEPKVFGDDRGFFFESFQADRYQHIDVTPTFVQDNISRSQHGVLRGLHYQLPHAQSKLITVIRGEVFDVAVDIRLDSPTFGKWCGVRLSDKNHRQLYIPEGFAHGFCVLSDVADFHYKCSDYYHPECERAIIWNDEDIAIQWPLTIDPLLSKKDECGNRLNDIPEDLLPKFV